VNESAATPNTRYRLRPTACAFGVVVAIMTPLLLAAQSPASGTGRTGAWKLDVSKSPMDDSPTVVVSLRADAPVQVWLKSVQPTLILRCKERRLDAYVSTDTAANVESDDRHTVRLRFDANAAAAQNWSESTDHAGLFAPAPAEFLNRLRTTSRLLFQFDPFNAPPVIVSFSTSDLATYAQRIVAACPAATKTAAQRASDQRRADAQQLAERKRTNPISGDLVGATENAVKERLGEPRYIDGARWTFEMESETVLRLYFRDGKVIEAGPSDAPLARVKRRSEPPEATPAKNVPPPPPDAVARCGNGQFVYVSTGADTCKGYGGVDVWYKKPSS
jgi:type VI secretion system protein VasI